MTKKHHFYKVDFGDTIRIMGKSVLKRYYETEINHDVADCGYPDFES